MRAQQRREDRARVRDQRDAARLEPGPLQVAERPEPVGHVDEAHAPRPAHGHRPRCGPDVGRQTDRAAVDHCPTGPDAAGQGEVLGDHRVRHPEQHQVHGVVEVLERGPTGLAEHGLVRRVHQVHPPHPAGPVVTRAKGLQRQPLAEGPGPGAGADHRDRARSQHAVQVGRRTVHGTCTAWVEWLFSHRQATRSSRVG